MEANQESNSKHLLLWVLARLGAIFLLLLSIGLLFYYVSDSLGGTITFSILFVLPYCLSAISALLLYPFNDEDNIPLKLIPVYLVFGVLIVGSLVWREGVICIAMLAPIWLTASYGGIYTIRLLYKSAKKRNSLHSVTFALLPFALVMFEGEHQSDFEEYTVSRSIVIEAPATEIWPHLLSMQQITSNEGRWNISQNILSIPRPSSAVVTGKGVGAWRSAKWGGNISFEEHIIEWAENETLRWKFVFPNDSVHKYTDEHISPDGNHLKINDGGYSLIAINETKTKITLDTVYSAATPMNTYSALWGELILGDIQNNILKIVKDRSEKS